MGAVWAAQHLRLPGKQVAIKVLHARAPAGDASRYARFRREAEIASRLGHPNIVEVLDFNTLPTGTPYLVLEYLQGESAGAAGSRAGRLPLDEALAITRQIGSALAGRAPRTASSTATSSRTTSSCADRDRTATCRPGEGPRLRHLEDPRLADACRRRTPSLHRHAAVHGAGAGHRARTPRSTPRTDVFALGAIVYEMLGGAARVRRRLAGRGGLPGGARATHAAPRAGAGAARQRARRRRPRAPEGPRRPATGHRCVHPGAHRPAPAQLPHRSAAERGLRGRLAGTHPHPASDGPPTSWPKTRASSREPVRSGAVTVPPPMPEAAPRRLLPFLGLVALVGVALGRRGSLLGLAEKRRAADADREPRPARATERLEPPPPPPPTPAPPQLAVEPQPAREPARAEPPAPVREKPLPGRKHRARAEGAKATEPQTVASAEPAKAVEPEPPAAPARPTASSPRRASCWTRPRTRSRRTSRSTLPGWWTRASTSRRRRWVRHPGPGRLPAPRHRRRARGVPERHRAAAEADRPPDVRPPGRVALLGREPDSAPRRHGSRCARAARTTRRPSSAVRSPG